MRLTMGLKSRGAFHALSWRARIHRVMRLTNGLKKGVGWEFLKICDLCILNIRKLHICILYP